MKESAMFVFWQRALVWSTLAGMGLLLAACGTSVSRAPVEERHTTKPPGVMMDPNTISVKQQPGFENAGKAGYYAVKPGESLIRVGLETGQNWKDIARWNNLEAPYPIQVGQVLRVVPPTAATAGAASAAAAADVTVAGAAAPGGVVTRPIAAASVASVNVMPGQASSAAKPAASAPAAAATAEAAATGVDEQLGWIWPVNGGQILTSFDEVKNKGLDLSGSAGHPVLAAADGRVVYVGAGLRGYGNLIILKHNSTYLTAYAHNQSLLVKEDQSVRKGQKIAEMGSSDADRVKLHFEVRRQGKPVDPAKYLPVR
jgi:lipoprotein NlpD